MRSIACCILVPIFCRTIGQTITVGGKTNAVCRGTDTVPGVHTTCYSQQTSVGHLVRIEPNKVGEVVDISIGDRELKRITRAIRPPVYEIPGMLTSKECDAVMRGAQQQGMRQSALFSLDAPDLDKEIQEKDLREIARVSNTSFLHYRGEHLINIRNKVMELTGLPKNIIFESEPLQVLRYGPGGHYHGHWDSESTEPTEYHMTTNTLPCCHQSPHCNSLTKLPGCCRLCRFATVLFYLNDVDEGGETAFPWALLNDTDKLPSPVNNTKGNLSYNCHLANLVVKPSRGTAVLWYSHFLDKEGWMDKLDPASFHGGCDVKKGTKWIANSWINAPRYPEINRPSVWKNV